MNMDKRRKKIIIGAVALATVIILAAILFATCGKNKAGAIPETEETTQEASASETTRETEKEAEKETIPAKEKESRETTFSRITDLHESFEESAAAQAETWGAVEGTEETAGWQEWEETAERQTEPTTARQPDPVPETTRLPETTAHVHSYVLEGTKTVEHPVVTEQVWVEDTPAWDEVIREGYHVSVVTCHECGAQFSGTPQAAALKAWGDHTDAVHDGDGGYDMAASYDVPAEIRHHDAVGHYETQTITAAWTEYIDTYRCSCGDSYTQTR